MPNQFSKAREMGIDPGDEQYPDGANQFTKGTRTEHAEDVRAKIKASNIVARLEKIVEESENESAVIAAGKILLDKKVSNLSSVDQTIRDETEEMDYTSLKAKVMAIITANPALLPDIQGEVAQAKVGETVLKAVGE